MTCRPLVRKNNGGTRDRRELNEKRKKKHIKEMNNNLRTDTASYEKNDDLDFVTFFSLFFNHPVNATTTMP